MLLCFRIQTSCYCAFCKTPRRIYAKKHIDLTNVALAGAFSALATLAGWGSLDPQGLMILGLSLICAEMFVYLRWRMNLVCHLCGFDPITYKRSPAAAKEQVKRFYEEQVNNPEFWLTKSPLLAVQKGIRLQERRALEQQIISNRARSSALAPAKTP